MIEAFSCWPALEWAGIGCIFVRRDAIFAKRKGVIAIVAKNLCNRAGSGRNLAVPAGKSRRQHSVGESRNVHRRAIAACQQRRAGGGADCGRVKVGIAQTIGSESVESGSLDEAAERVGSAKTHIIQEN